MSVYLLASAKGSPGVTTGVLATATEWPQAAGRRVLVVDADLAGSGILPGYLRADLPERTGLLALAAARPKDLSTALLDATAALDPAGEVLLLPGLTDPAQAVALTELWASLLPRLRDLGEEGIDVLIDAGRITQPGQLDPLVQAADARVLVTRSTLVSLAGARPFLQRANGAGQAWRVLVVGPGRPYSVREVGSALAIDQVLDLPWAPRAASTFSDGAEPGWRHPHAALCRGARALAHILASTCDVGRQETVADTPEGVSTTIAEPPVVEVSR